MVDIEDFQNAESGKYSISPPGASKEFRITNKITAAYRSIIANGQKIEAPEGKCFIITASLNGVAENSSIRAEFSLSNYSNKLSKEITL